MCDLAGSLEGMSLILPSFPRGYRVCVLLLSTASSESHLLLLQLDKGLQSLKDSQ